MKAFDPLFGQNTKKPTSESFVISSKPLDPLVQHEEAVAKKSAVEAYTHIDAYTCPARGCGKPMQDAMLSNHEVVSYCPTHRIAFPKPL